MAESLYATDHVTMLQEKATGGSIDHSEKVTCNVMFLLIRSCHLFSLHTNDYVYVYDHVHPAM